MEKAVSLVMSTSVSMLPRSIGKATEIATEAGRWAGCPGLVASRLEWRLVHA